MSGRAIATHGPGSCSSLRVVLCCVTKRGERGKRGKRGKRVKEKRIKDYSTSEKRRRNIRDHAITRFVWAKD